MTEENRCLVTRSAGAPGSTIVGQPVIAGTDKAVVLANFVRGHTDEVAHAVGCGNVTTIEGDIRDRCVVSQLMAGLISYSIRRLSRSNSAPKSPGRTSTSSSVAQMISSSPPRQPSDRSSLHCSPRCTSSPKSSRRLNSITLTRTTLSTALLRPSTRASSASFGVSTRRADSSRWHCATSISKAPRCTSTLYACTSSGWPVASRTRHLGVIRK